MCVYYYRISCNYPSFSTHCNRIANAAFLVYFPKVLCTHTSWRQCTMLWYTAWWRCDVYAVYTILNANTSTIYKKISAVYMKRETHARVRAYILRPISTLCTILCACTCRRRGNRMFSYGNPLSASCVNVRDDYGTVSSEIRPPPRPSCVT